MGILLGLVAAVGWGISDVLVTQAARRIGVGRLMIFFEGLGMLAVAALLLAWPGMPRPTLGAWTLVIGLGLLNCLGAFLLYRAFEIGTLALVAPLASGYAVVTTALALIGGERLPLLVVVGALIVVAGVVVVTRANYAGAIGSLRGMPETLGVVVLFGIFYWALNFVTPSLGIYWPIFVLRLIRVLAGLAIVGSVLAVRDVPLARLAVAALLSTAAFVAFNLGLTSSSTTVVVTIASLASAVTVILARIMLREQLSGKQWLGVGLIIVGVLLISQ